MEFAKRTELRFLNDRYAVLEDILRVSASPREIFPGVPPKILSRKGRKENESLGGTANDLECGAYGANAG